MDEVQNIRSGFTLLELVMAIMILAVMMILSFFCFDAVVQSWNAGMEMSDAMSQADYVMNQVESGLRSAYYSASVQKDDERGFQFTDGGEGPEARDSIAWMKEGRAFVGNLKAIDGKAEIADMPHRVMLYVEDEGQEGGGGLMAKAWSSDFQPDDFDVEEDVKAFLVSPRIMGMDCKVLKEPPEANDKEVEWEDEWTSSNALPYKVSVTLFLRPVKERDEPVAVTRDIELPVWDVSQNPVQSGGAQDGKTPTSSPLTGPGAAPDGRLQQGPRGGQPGTGGMPRQPITPGGRPGMGGVQQPIAPDGGMMP